MILYFRTLLSFVDFCATNTEDGGHHSVLPEYRVDEKASSQTAITEISAADASAHQDSEKFDDVNSR